MRQVHHTNKGSELHSYLEAKRARQKIILHNLAYKEENNIQEATNVKAILKYMKKYRTESSFDPNNIWQLAYERNRAKLAIMLILYLYINNDNVLSQKEEKRLQKIIKREKIFLHKEDSLFLNSLATKRPTLQTFIEYLKVNELKQDIFDEAVETIHKDIKSDSDYKALLADLKQNVKEVIKIKK